MKRLLVALTLVLAASFTGTAFAQHKPKPVQPVPHVSELVARQAFVLMQFIEDHSSENNDTYDKFITEQLDQMREFDTREPDQALIELLTVQNNVQGFSGLATKTHIDNEQAFKVVSLVVDCDSEVAQSIRHRHVDDKSYQVCNASVDALQKIVEAQIAEREKAVEQPEQAEQPVGPPTPSDTWSVK
jgi:hypothetical protein